MDEVTSLKILDSHREMRNVIFESSISMDGFIEGPNGELDWLTGREEMFDPRAFFSSFDTIFYGRKTYEVMSVTGPGTADMHDNEREFHHMLHRMRKYVFSRGSKHVKGNAMVISDNIRSEVCRIREEEGKNIWFCGGADILKTFIAFDLVDEYLLTMYPVLLQKGKPLFTGNGKPMDLRLTGKHALKSGLVILHYIPESRLK